MKKKILGLAVLLGLCPTGGLLNEKGLDFCNQVEAGSYSRIGEAEVGSGIKISPTSSVNIMEFMPIEYDSEGKVIPTGACDVLFANGYPVEAASGVEAYGGGFKFTESGYAFFGDYTNISVSSSGPGDYIKSICVAPASEASSFPGDEGMVKFGDGSIFGVSTETTKRADASIKGPGALSDVTSVSVGNSKLVLLGELEDGAVYDIMTGTTGGLPTDEAYLWDLKNDVLMLNPNWNEDYELTYLPLDGYTISFTATRLKIFVNGTDADDVFTEMVDKSRKGTIGYDFVKAAVDDAGNTITILNNAANIAELGGASRGLFNAGMMTLDGMDDHMSGLKEIDGKFSKEIWGTYLHDHTNISNMSIGSVSSNSKDQYNGVIVGADLWDHRHNFGGVAVIYGGATICSSSDMASTRNEADYYGVAAYNRHDLKSFSFLADVSVIRAKNDIIQYNNNFELTTVPKAMIYGAGIRAQQEYILGSNITVMPYVGIRYNYLKNNKYSDNLAMSHQSANQSVITPKIGVNVQQVLEMEGWKVIPSASIGYLWNMGAKEIGQQASFNSASNDYEFDIADSNCYIAKLGVQASRGTGTFGVDYEYKKGHALRESKWNITCSWTF